MVAGEERVLAVFDGLGGHPCGDVASATAAESLQASAAEAAASADGLVAALHAAHEAVLAAAAEDLGERAGMATTAVVATVGDGTVLVGHVGDSRGYLLDADGRVRQVTEDHGLGGYITQALGLDRGVEPDVVQLDTPPGSRLLLCSDGLSNMVDEAGIGSLLGEGDAQQACDALVEAALAAGGIDNVTVVVAVF
jgi:protein phosphatase